MRGGQIIIAALSLLVAVLIGIFFVVPIGNIWFEYRTVRPYIAKNFKPYLLTQEAERSKRTGDVFRECARNCPEMVVVPAGTFWMGSPNGTGHPRERPRRKVNINRAFAVSKFEVTRGEWQACVALRGCEPPSSNSGSKKERLPVVNVSWVQANSYASWLSRMTGKPYRLLTEAEWEYAARGVTNTEIPHPDYPWGDEPSHEFANYGADQCCRGKQEGRDRWIEAAPVGQFPSNAFGLYDMHGNVWEWVADLWHDDYRGNPPSDGTAWLQGGDAAPRVVRGGSWGYPSVALRSASRLGLAAGYQSNGLGIRIGRSLSP